MPKAAELKRGNVVEINGAPHAVKQVEAKSPSSRGASTLYKIRFNNLLTGQKYDGSYKGDDLLKEIDCVRRAVQYSYREDDMLIFMDTEDYSQYTLSTEVLEAQLPYLIDGMEGMVALVVDEQAVTIEMPQSVELEIIETAPGIKGASASGRTKPAMLNSGLEIQVPEYLEAGERIKVNTGDGKFISRA